MTTRQGLRPEQASNPQQNERDHSGQSAIALLVSMLVFFKIPKKPAEITGGLFKAARSAQDSDLSP
jgi:hypothetical protein